MPPIMQEEGTVGKRSREWLVSHKPKKPRLQHKLVEPENPQVFQAMMETIDNQLAENSPPETQQTLDRLISEGYSEEIARRLMAVVLLNEIAQMMRTRQPYDDARYIAALHRLPTLPEDH
jgi:NAD-specific glutamate dehydrogenase